MPLKLYGNNTSPVVRPVRLFLETYKIPHESINVDLQTSQNKTKELSNLNPKQNIPVIVDEDGFTLTDSNAILIYLAEKYSGIETLYPTDLKARSIVNERLFLQTDIFNRIVRPIVYEHLRSKTLPALNQFYFEQFEKYYSVFDGYLKKTNYIAGDQLTVADFSILSILMRTSYFVPIYDGKFPRLFMYFAKVKKCIPTAEKWCEIENAALKESYKNFDLSIVPYR